MPIYFDPTQLDHQPSYELSSSSQLIPPLEHAGRAKNLLQFFSDNGIDVSTSADYGLSPISRVHDAEYLIFLQTIWARWQQAGKSGEIIPNVWPARANWQQRIPKSLIGQVGYYALGADTTLTANSWVSAYASAQSAINAAAHLADKQRFAYALCRPPGHHAGIDQFGGYCFLNNAAIGAQYLRDHGAQRVAILDVDFHHGNGTQHIFYQRDDVLTISLHGEPETTFPHFLGYADETGQGAGEGYNLNLPLPTGTDYRAWMSAFEHARQALERYSPDALVIALGVDTFKDDPHSQFVFESDDFLRLGEALAALKLPSIICQEGGYAVEEIGLNVCNVLRAFESFD